MVPRKLIPFADPSENVFSRASRHRQFVVQIGRDPELLRLRAKILHSAGYTIHSIFPEEATAEVRKAQGGHIWIFCHTLEFYELALLAVDIRSSWPADKLLCLAGLTDIQQPPWLFDEWLNAVGSLDELLSAVGRLVNQSAR